MFSFKWPQEVKHRISIEGRSGCSQISATRSWNPSKTETEQPCWATCSTALLSSWGKRFFLVSSLNLSWTPVHYLLPSHHAPPLGTCLQLLDHLLTSPYKAAIMFSQTLPSPDGTSPPVICKSKKIHTHMKKAAVIAFSIIIAAKTTKSWHTLLFLKREKNVPAPNDWECRFSKVFKETDFY